MGNTIKTRLCERIRTDNDPSRDKIKFQVRTDDLGNENKAFVHVFDKNNRAVDVEVPRWVGKAQGGSDDLFEGEIAVKDLLAKNPQLDTSELYCTSFGTVPGQPPIWEGSMYDSFANHKIAPQGQDRLDTIEQRGGYPGPYGVRGGFRTTHTNSGTAKFEIMTISDYSYRGSESRVALKGVSFQDTRNFFDGAAEVKVLVMPSMWTKVKRDGRFVDKVDQALDLSNVITLKRQADGSYSASAPDHKAFILVKERSTYAGEIVDQEKAIGFRFALFDPATKKWDSNNGGDYFLNIGTER